MNSLPHQNQPSRWTLPILMFVALIIRVIYLWLYQDMPQWDQLTVDNYYHYHWAESIANGNYLGDTTNFRAPRYAFIRGLADTRFGVCSWVARILGLLIGMASIYCTYLLGRRAFSHQVGLVAAAVQSLTPIILYFEFELLLDMTFTLTLQLSLLALWRWLTDQRSIHLLVAGVVTGLAAICRPTALVWASLVILWLPFMSGNAIARLRRLAIFVIGLTLVIGPIFVRNLMIADDPALIASQGGINFYIGNNKTADGVSAKLPEPLGFNWRQRQVVDIAEKAVGHPLKPGEVSNYWTSRSLDWISNYPGEAASLFLKKLYYFISNREASNNRDLRSFFAAMPLLQYNPISFAIIFGFGLLGALTVWRRGGIRGKSLIFLLLSYPPVVALFFFNSRFRLPILPLLIVLAAVGALTVLDLFATQIKRGLIAITVVIIGWACSYYPLLSAPRGSPAQDFVSKGIHFYIEQDYQLALKYFYTARLLDPSYPETNMNIGACYLRLGQGDSTLFYFEKERYLHPQRSKTYTNLASFHLVNGQFEEAATLAEKALALTNWDITTNMIYIRSLAKQDSVSTDCLITELEKAASRTSNDPYLLNDAAMLFLDRGDTLEAESILQRALHTQPPPIETDDGAFDRDFPNHYTRRQNQKARTYYHLGLLAGLTGRYHQAISYNSQAIAADSGLVEAYLNLANGHRLIGQLETSDSILTIANHLFPENKLVGRMIQMQLLQKETGPSNSVP